jgi:RNA 2',3'-cyclic 3'-phosphodiesterase
MARLFVAADLPEGVRARLASLKAPGRRMARESLHVTLCFLGELDEAEIPDIGAVVDEVRAQTPVWLSAGEVLWLPPRRPRVCAVRLIDSDAALGALQASLSSALVAGGWYVPERRPFLAHVTVARLRGEGPTELAAPGGLEPFAVPSVTLYRSCPGSRYEPLASVALPVS